MARTPFAESLASGAHARLASLVGAWRGTSRLWLEPGVLTDESPIEGTFRAILGGRFLLHEYRTAVTGEPVDGLAILGYELASGRFLTAWVDSWHNGTTIMLSTGAKAPADAPWSVLGSYPDPTGGPSWGWRTEIQVPDPQHVVLTHFNVPPGGEEAKAVEVLYTRA